MRIPSREEVFEFDEDTIAKLEEALGTKPNKKNSLDFYCPEKPWPKQKAFLECTAKEVLFGGSAGPGKSSALLMAALQYVHVPGYSALLLRRDFSRLALPGSIMDRARSWLYNTDAKWNQQTKSWRFPSGAVLQFGFIDSVDDRYRYASSEYQFVGFDELTEFLLPDDDSNPYLFLYSRLRKTSDIDVPLRMRAASNPGNIGHEFVKKRFKCDQIDTTQKSRKTIYRIDHDKCYIPALLKDNPAINPDEYIPNLMHLPKVTRDRLLRGDWKVRADGIINETNIRFASMSDRGDIVINSRSGAMVTMWPAYESYRFMTCDPAGTSQDKALASKGKAHSYSVISVFDLCPVHMGRFLVVRDVWKERVTFPDLCQKLREMFEEWHPTRIRIENEKLGLAAVDVLKSELPIAVVPTGGKDKLTRAGPLQMMVERGEFYLMSGQLWTDEVVTQMIGWTGHPDEQSDVIDAFAYGAIEASGVGKGEISPECFDESIWYDRVPPGFDKVIVSARCADMEDVASQAAVVVAGIRRDGKVYLEAWVDHWNTEQLCQYIGAANHYFACPISVAVSHLDDAQVLTLHWTSHFRAVNCDPEVLFIDPEENLEATLPALADHVKSRIFKFRRDSIGCQAIVNRLKSYPRHIDDRPLEALALAVAGLLELAH